MATEYNSVLVHAGVHLRTGNGEGTNPKNDFSSKHREDKDENKVAQWVKNLTINAAKQRKWASYKVYVASDSSKMRRLMMEIGASNVSIHIHPVSLLPCGRSRPCYTPFFTLEFVES